VVSWCTGYVRKSEPRQITDESDFWLNQAAGPTHKKKKRAINVGAGHEAGWLFPSPLKKLFYIWQESAQRVESVQLLSMGRILQ
jgi:hypothetical protein